MSWSGEQIRNAALIYQVGRQMGMSSRDIQIGLMAAMVESNLVNVHYGDRDSLGLFQQRPSAGWGTPAQVLNPQYAAKKFFTSLRNLGDRRNNMSMGSAAQAVQRSAYPGRYDQHIGDVRALWPRIANVAGDQQQSMDGGPYSAPENPAPHSQSGLKDTGFNVDQLAKTDSLGVQPTSMLDAWDGSTVQPMEQPDPSGMLGSEPRTFISPGTNEAVITPMAQTTGSYGKGVDGWRKGVIQTARQFVGVPYVWGGTSPNGFDCSGFVQYVYGRIGKPLPRISYQQANAGHRIGLKALRPGDLVAWDNSSRNNGADHIAIYLGNGQIIEAPRPGLSVRIRSLGSNEGAWGVSMG